MQRMTIIGCLAGTALALTSHCLGMESLNPHTTHAAANAAARGFTAVNGTALSGPVLEGVIFADGFITDRTTKTPPSDRVS